MIRQDLPVVRSSEPSSIFITPSVAPFCIYTRVCDRMLFNSVQLRNAVMKCSNIVKIGFMDTCLSPGLKY
jgi:hypothetical protein